jgi:hemerythrin-like domain-containing protein
VTLVHDYVEGFHEGIEEGYVFPRLRAAGAEVETVDTLLTQHGRGRRITQSLLQLRAADLASATMRTRTAAALASFVRMYQPHEAREDTVIFPAFRRLSTPAELRAVAGEVATFETAQFGAGHFTRAVDQVAAVEVALGINDLSSFTPAG